MLINFVIELTFWEHNGEWAFDMAFDILERDIYATIICRLDNSFINARRQ